MSKVTLEDIHECLIGNKLAGQKGIISTIDDLVENQTEMNNKVCKMDDRQCIMQNHLNTLMLDREKRIQTEQQKEASKLVFRKFLSTITLGLIKLKTGI
jgi:hypothetical protein